MPEDIRFLRAAPCLASLNQDETAAFYGRLGFAQAWRYPGYMSMRRDGLEIHFWDCRDPEIPKATSCYVYMEGVDALYDEYSALDGVIHPKGALEDKPWRMREFAILDSHGNLIRFGRRLAQEPSK